MRKTGQIAPMNMTRKNGLTGEPGEIGQMAAAALLAAKEAASLFRSLGAAGLEYALPTRLPGQQQCEAHIPGLFRKAQPREEHPDNRMRSDTTYPSATAILNARQMLDTDALSFGSRYPKDSYTPPVQNVPAASNNQLPDCETLCRKTAQLVARELEEAMLHSWEGQLI